MKGYQFVCLKWVLNLYTPLNNISELSESWLLPNNMEDGQCCPCPQKGKKTNSEQLLTCFPLTCL